MESQQGSGARDRAALVLKGLRKELPIRMLCRQHGLSRAAYYRWQTAFIAGGIDRLSRERGARQALRTDRSARAALSRLARECNRLRKENAILLSALALHRPVSGDPRAAAPEWRQKFLTLVRASGLGVRRMLRLLGMPRSTYYYWRRLLGSGAGRPRA